MLSRLPRIREVRLDDNANAPRSMAAVAENPAFFLIFHKFIHSSEAEAHFQDADTRKQVGFMLDFIQESRALYKEPDKAKTISMAKAMWVSHMAPNAPLAIDLISTQMKANMCSLIDAGCSPSVQDARGAASATARSH